MRSIFTALAVLISIGSAVASRAEVTNISNQHKTTIVGNNITTIDSRSTVIKNGKVLTKPRSTVGGLKLKIK